MFKTDKLSRSLKSVPGYQHESTHGKNTSENKFCITEDQR